MYKYSFRVLWSEADNAYVATCPELPGVSALGESEGEALREAKVAMELYIEDMLESGESLPEPQIAHEYSGQTRVRFSKDMHRQAAQRAEREGVSLNRLIENAVAALLGSYDAYEYMRREMKQIFAEQFAKNSLVTASRYNTLGEEG